MMMDPCVSGVINAAASGAARPALRSTFARFAAAVLLGACLSAEASAQPCGSVVTLPAHGAARLQYALAGPDAPHAVRGALVLLAGGDGVLDLDAQGCPRLLKGNSLVRSSPLFRAAGWATAMVDAPSDHRQEDGLAAFRASAEHAEDLGRVIADLRRRGHHPVWVLGTSRGSISAANAAARLRGAAAPDGMVLTSLLTVGTAAGRKPWTAQTVFDLPLEAVAIPTLLVGHALDRCMRSPADAMPRVEARITSARRQVVVVAGGSGTEGPRGLEACEGRSPHGFHGQETELVTGILRFIDGGRY
ncbi:MAG: alpha/beta hydrolase [Polaromonas sp.]|nr:alpha/beta hydrolase [Polaromonas sp.]